MLTVFTHVRLEFISSELVCGCPHIFVPADYLFVPAGVERSSATECGLVTFLLLANMNQNVLPNTHLPAVGDPFTCHLYFLLSGKAVQASRPKV